MGLFGKKKDYTEMAIEEARRLNAADVQEGSAPKDPALAALMEKAFGGNRMDASNVTSGETVSVTTVRRWGADDAQLKDAIAALGFGPVAPLQAPGGGPQEPDSGFSAALDAIERDYKGKPAADAKAAIEAALKERHHTIPDEVLDRIAKGVSEGAAIEVKFGGSPQTPPAS